MALCCEVRLDAMNLFESSKVLTAWFIIRAGTVAGDLFYEAVILRSVHSKLDKNGQGLI